VEKQRIALFALGTLFGGVQMSIATKAFLSVHPFYTDS
jgi:hypothetical protein